MPQHIIHKQTVTLELPNPQNSNLFQNKVSHLLRNDVNQAMEAVFDKISASGEVIRIDKLVLDLGEITPADFEAEFKSRLMYELGKELSKIKNGTESGKATVMKPVDSMMAVLQYFLSTGRLPWYAGSKKMPEWEAEILEKFTLAEWKKLADWIRTEYSSNPTITERLARQFSDKFIIKLLSESGLGFDWSAEPGLIYADLVLFIKNIAAKQISDLRFKAWHRLLEAASDRKSFVRVLREILESAIGEAPAAPVIETLKKKNWSIQFKTATARKAIKELLKDEAFISKLEKKAKEETRSKSKKAASGEAEQTKLKDPKKKKSAEKREIADEEGEFIFVQNCGIVLLTPFLKPYFADLGLLDNKDFVDEEAQKRAVLLLHHLATGETEVAEFDLAFQKLLCGLPMDTSLPNMIKLTEKEHAEAQELLKPVTQHWVPLNNTSVEGLRLTFLQREGKLQQLEPDWKLQVETKTVDILLDKLPWGYSTIRLPWLKYTIHVDWY